MNQQAEKLVTSIPRTTFPKLELGFLSYQKGGKVVGCWNLSGARLLCSHNCPGRSQCYCKPLIRQTLFSVMQLFISVWMERCYTLEGQSLGNGPFSQFQALGNQFLICSQSNRCEGESERNRSDTEADLFFLMGRTVCDTVWAENI